jgi:hypothetical protein
MLSLNIAGGTTFADIARQSQLLVVLCFTYQREPRSDCRVGNRDVAMRDFAFKVDLVAIVRVRAADEDSARKAAPEVLGAPSTADIRIVNDNLNLGLGIDAVIEDVEFNVAPNVDLIGVNGERVKRRRR